MLPQHIAFIMDGNGRWANSKGKPRKYGHKIGTEALKLTVENCAAIGIKAVTFYAFSTENWNRPQDELDALFELIRKFVCKDIDKYSDRNFKVRFIGDLTKIPSDIADKCGEITESSKNNTGMVICIALNYGSVNEVVHAVNNILSQGNKTITEKDLFDNLYTAGIPNPDLIVRTAGEKRLSNFLLLQAAYAELVFVDICWPDFDKSTLDTVIAEYGRRVRHFGGVGAENVKA